MSPTVVITDCDHGDVLIEAEIFDAAGVQWRLECCRSAQDVLQVGTGAQALITQYAPISREVIEGLPQCRVLARYGTGLDAIDLNAARDRGLVVVSVPDYAVDEVSDHALALVLSLTRGVVLSDRAARAGRWNLSSVPALRRTSALCLGLLGVGRIGAAVARKAAAVGFRVIAHDLQFVPPGIHAVSMDELLAISDVISVHVPLTPSTHHLLGAEQFARMRPGALLVNTARGGVVDESALTAALASGRVAGAGLDVLEIEPPNADSELLSHPGVVITPHIGFYSKEALDELKTRVATGVVEGLRATVTKWQ